MIHDVLFAAAACCFTLAGFVLFVGMIGVAQRLSNGLWVEAATVAATALITAAVPGVPAALAACTLTRLVARERRDPPRGFDVLPPV